MALLSRSKSAKSLLHISRKSTKQHTPLFDIRLDTPDKDVLVLKGAAEEAPPVMLSGVVVLSVTEPIAVKKLNLQLYATITMHWEDKYRSSNGSIFKKPYSHTAVIFNYQWDSLNLQEFLEQKTREVLAGEGAGWKQGGEAMSRNGSMGGSIVGSVEGSVVGSVRGSLVGLSGAARAASPGTQELSPGTTPGTQVAPPGTLDYRVPSSSSLVGFTTGHQAGSHSSSYSSLSSLPSVHAAEAAAASLEANSVGSGSTEASGDMPNSGSAGNPLARSFSTSNLRRNKSATTLAGLSSAVSTKLESTVLAPGNYEFPFRTVLQGSIPESIDGLKGCSLVYRMQSVLERSRFSRPILTQRIVHVVRTLRADASELTETVAVDNTWPGKVDYSISVPTRAIAVGSVCNVEIILVPLAKGLRLGTVKIKLAEYASLVTLASSHTQEKHVLTKKIPPALADSPDRDVWDPESYAADPEGVFYRSQYLTLSEDRWLVQAPLQIPASLAHITQDCDIKGSVKVRHKLKFSIGLVNPDGHVSELRATLPISIFVSPFVPVSARGLDGFVAPFSLSNYEDATLKVPGSDTLFEATMAPPSIHSLSSSSTAHNSFVAGSPLSHLNISTAYSSPQLHRGASAASVITAADAQPNGQLSTQQLMAPPSYEHHIFDQLCQAADDAVRYDPPALMNQVGNAASKEGGNATSDRITKATSATNPPSTNPPSSNPPPTLSSFPQPSIISGPSFQNGHAHYRNGTSFSTANLSAIASPQSITPVQYLSRVGSFINEPRSPGTEKWNTKALSRVPSYETAIKTDAASEYLTPAYEPPNLESQINLDLLDSRLESVNESADSSHVPERPPLHTYASEISAHTARRSHGPAKFTLQGNEDPADHQSAFSHSTYQTAASSSAMPSLSRTRSSGSMLAAAHALKPSFGSTTSLLSKQFHMLHRINSNTSIGSKEDGSSTAGSLRGKRSKSTLNFHLFHH
ncbi:hypothetical protein HII12_005460 [Brettanomyces bruxellensis]|uniref:Arrestin C-terminal-like domain-containing protein n=1 Tax=Dekkera bruxellensis TaxID=5007 RepID=A0A8H6B6Y8_DEKBR|nr:hypothetical protein HII12_005460 [Brettanomyces bruxellensis]